MSKLNDEFFEQHWQKYPVVLRQFFESFDGPLDENELAGLALEDDIDSRIISFDRGQWNVEHGPFDSFDDVCKGAWTLLVQHVDKYIEGVDALVRPFRIIPHWRIDDVMVSFATAQAGVGPHVDQYDVFLVQGKGSRKWRVGKPSHYQTCHPHPDLQQITGFEMEFEVTLMPGDVLYIPPGWPHDGIALEPCLTYSVGFRAPDCAALSQVLSAMLCEKLTTARYADPSRTKTLTPGEVSADERHHLKALLHQAVDSSEFDEELMRFLSEQQLDSHVNDALDAHTIRDRLNQGDVLIPVPGCRPIYKQSAPSIDTLYVDGDSFDVSSCPTWLTIALVNGDSISREVLSSCTELAIYELLAKLVSRGFWIIKLP